MQVFRRYLTESEERQLLKTVGERGGILARRDHAWMEALRCTGVRIQAFSKLTVSHAQHAIRTHELVLEGAIQKRGRAHVQHVAQRGRRAFRRLLAIRGEQGYPLIPDAPLVISRNRQALSVRSYQARMQLWVGLAGLDVSASPHWFRHTLAKRVVARSTARDPAALVQGILGHTSRNSAAVYTRPDREDLVDALEAAS